MNWSERAEKAANFLAETDGQLAELKVQYERDKRKTKRIHSAIFLRTPGTVGERNATAEAHEHHQEAQMAEMDSLLAYEKLRNKRDSAREIIHFWMSYQKALREGEVL